MLPDRNDPLVGTMLGKDYRVLEPIGQGGMAVVYLVEHQTLLKQFAAKVLSPALATSLEARARFAQEAHAASQLDHENIVSISDFGATIDQRPFFVMELLRGKTLDQRLAEGPMSLEEVVAVAVPVARALAHAHAEGIVHLDIKPENIFLVQRSQGRWGVKVVDFGIAKTPLNPRMTKVGETAGSPMFMAPEVCQGSDDVDLRADVYSFGIVLYLMLCGRLPFVDDNVARILQMQLVELPAPPREINEALSPELAAIVERCLAKDPRDRYPLMAVLLRDFQAALPDDADRLLIEQQSGAPLVETPFPRTMSLGMFDSQPQLITQPGPTQSLQMPAAHPMRPSGLHASQPSSIPGRRRAWIVLTTALLTVALALAGALVWKRMNLSKQAGQIARRDGNATSLVQAGGAPAAAAPVPVQAAPAAAPSEPAAAEPAAAAPAAAQADTAAVAANDQPADEAAASDDDQQPPARLGAAALPGKLSRPAAISPKSPQRPKPTVRRDQPARPGKRVATASPAPGAPAGSAAKSSPVALPIEPAPAEPAPAVAAIEPARPEPAAPPPPVAAQPVALPPPAPPVIVSRPIAPAPTQPAGPGALDAVPAVTSLDVKGSLSPAIVRRGIERSLGALRNCYRTAAKAGGATPAIDLQLNFEIDENGLATQVSTGGTAFGSLPGCAASVASQIRTQEAPDVGTVQVSVGIRFRPS